ncbi:MAG: hypothetical protein IJY70_04795, partial [Clostridia bacterium]|nr:hypothetical protein [Clostridia bacterium]
MMKEDKKKELKEKVKKSKRGCGCALASLSIFLVVLIGGLGVGAFFADGYLQDNFGIGIIDAVGLVGNLSNPNRSEVVTNATTQNDKDSLYQSFDEKLLFKDGTFTQENMDDILNEIFKLDTGESQPLTGGSGSLSPTIENLIKKENIDYDAVRVKFVDGYDYESNYESDFVLTLTDRQLKIFAERLLMSNLESMGDGLNGLIEKITFEQLKMTRENDCPKMSITVRLDVDAFIDDYMPEGMEFPASVAKFFLPNEIFIILEVEMAEQNEYSFKFNAMDGDSQSKMYKLLSGILKLTGQEETDPNKFLYDLMDTAVVDFIDSASKWIDIENVTTDGCVTLDLYKLVAQSVAPDLTPIEFVKLYTSVVVADADNMLNEYRDNLFKQMSDGENPVYTAEKVQNEFKDEFHNKYLLHEDFYVDKDAVEGKQKVFFAPSQEQINSLGLTHYTLAFSDISALFGVGESDMITELNGYGVDLKSLLDTSGLMKKLGGDETQNRNEWFVSTAEDEQLKFIFTDKMLAALIDSQLESVLGGISDSFSGFELEFLQIEKGATESVANGNIVGNTNPDLEMVDINRVYVTLGFIVSTADLIDGVGAVGEIMPEKIGFVIKLDVTPMLVSSALNPYEISYCDLSASRTGEMLATLKKLGISVLTQTEVEDYLLTPIRDMFNSITEMMGEIAVENGKIVLNDIFEVIARQGFEPTPEVKVIYGNDVSVTRDEVKAVLKGLTFTPSTTVVGGREYLSDTPTAEETLNGVLGCANAYYGGKANDRETTVKFNDNFLEPTKENFGLSLNKVGDAIGYYNNSSERYMYITMTYDLSSYLYEQDMCLLPIKTVYATFVIDKQTTVQFSGASAYSTKLLINGMGESEMASLEKMLVFGNTDNYGAFTKLEGEMGILARLVDT